jgi:hypothetical protein
VKCSRLFLLRAVEVEKPKELFSLDHHHSTGEIGINQLDSISLLQKLVSSDTCSHHHGSIPSSSSTGTTAGTQYEQQQQQ